MSPLPAGPYLPTSDLVAVAWLRGVAGLPAGGVATSLPSDATRWADEGFVQAQTVTGLADVDVPQWRRPLVQVDCWANAGASDSPPWNKAARLVELIRAGTEGATGRTVDLGASYRPARVLSVYLESEPRRIEDDPAGFARFTLDLHVDWVRAHEA